MPRHRTIEPFFLVIVDDDRQLFGVVGPISDDTSWNNRVWNAQQRGRHVRCFTPGTSKTREQVIADAQRELRLTYSNEPLI
jgi:hypothetical protein